MAQVPGTLMVVGTTLTEQLEKTCDGGALNVSRPDPLGCHEERADQPATPLLSRDDV